MKRVRGVHCNPKNLDVPPKMKVKGYMYPQMKKPVGMLGKGHICHGSEVDNTLERVVDIPWEGVSNNIGRELNITWIGDSIYHG